MSIDFVVIPTKRPTVFWSEVRRLWINHTIESLKPLLENAGLLLVNNNTLVQDTSALEIGKFYNFRLKSENSIGLNLSTNEMLSQNERDFVEDFGRNMAEAEVEDLIQKWCETPFTITVVSQGARPKYESSLVISLLVALGELYSGSIVVMNDVLDLAVGIYLPTVLSKAKPKF
jgi:hypothetical protein